MSKNANEIEKIVLEVALDLSKAGEGALFVIGDKVDYKRLMKQKFADFSVFDSGSKKLLKSLATIDGAVIINTKGVVIDYGVLVKVTKTISGYGTRHSAAISASKNKNICVLCSEEEKKVKIFRDGKYVMQMDPLQKDVNKGIPMVVSVLESVGAGTIGAIGVATLAPTLGIALIPGVLVFGSGYYVFKKLIEKFE